MALVDHRLLMGGGNELAQGLLQGQSIRQNWQQSRDQGRTRAAAQAFQQAAQGQDITTPEGMGTAIRSMAQAGFADEARRVFEVHKDMFQEMAPKAPEYDFREDATGLLATPKNDPTKAVRVPGFTPKPTKAEPVKDKWGDIDWVTSGGKRVAVDVEGKDKSGNLVIPDKEPKRSGGLTDSQTAGILSGISRRIDDDKAIGIASRREGFYNTAKVAYDEYKAAPSAASVAQADQQLIYSLAKMRDEGVVMPGEFTRELMGKGWLQTALANFDAGITGGLAMTDKNRDYIVGLMKKYRDQAVKDAKPRYDFYRKQGEKYGDPEFAVGQWTPLFEGMEAQTAPPPAGARPSAPGRAPALDAAIDASANGAGPRPGMIEDGHRFKGGNPADPKNWEKVQ